MNYTDSEDKLDHAMKLFEDCVDHTVTAHIEAHRAERFYHNTECEGQWESEDMKYLRDQMRPALSFNIIKSKLDTFLGMYSDAQRTPVVSSSNDNELPAKVLDAVKEQVLQDAGYERLAARQLKTGTITGECSLHLEVVPSRDGEGWVKLNIYRVLPFEMHWDMSSVEPDRSDARYLFWDRWFDKQEFRTRYPDFADQWDVLAGRGEEYEGLGYASIGDDTWGEMGVGDSSWAGGDYSDDKWNRYYFDKRKNKIRVIRYEYLTTNTKYVMHNTESGERTDIGKEDVERVRLLERLGEPYQLIEDKVETTEVCEFVGNTVLGEYEEAGPFEGFSITPYCYDVDEETNTAYGLVRNLFDPQMELNKSISLEIEYIAQGAAPGIIIEKDQADNMDDLSDQIRQPGGVGVVKQGAISEGRMQLREASQPSQAVAMRRETAMNLISEVSTIPSAANLTAAEHAQAGVTVAIRHHKSRQSVSAPFAHYEDCQKRFVDKVVQAISAVMPDDQITAILASEGKYHIENGRILEMGPSPDQEGQMIPVAMGNLRDLRTLKWTFDMEYTSENSTLRMLELDMLMQLVNAGVPVDPDVLVERATNSKSIRERLKAYVETAEKAKAEAEKTQTQILQQQNEQFVQIESQKNQEATRHNMATERIQLTDMQIKDRLKRLEIWEKADETEKARLVDMAKFAIDQRNAQVQSQQAVN